MLQPPLPPHILMYITRKSFVGTFPGPNLTLRHHLVYQGRDDSSVQIVFATFFPCAVSLFSLPFEAREREANLVHDGTL